MGKHKKNIVLFFLCFHSIVFLAQPIRDTTKKIKWIGVPTLFKTPETGWAGGLSGSASFKTTYYSDTLTRTSIIQLLTIFSETHQNVQALDATIYWPNEAYVLYVQTSHSYFPDKFWGIGQHTQNNFEEKYAFEQFYFSTHLKKKITKHSFIGGIVDYQNVFKVNSILGGAFDSSLFFGKTTYQALGFGVSASYDTRNATFWPTKGIFAQANLTTYNKNIISSYNFTKWSVELRYFRQLYKKHILALQLYNYTTIGETPLRSLASLGGAGNLRGYYQGRFRDNSMYSIIAEYRAFLFWRFSACAFFGVGDVYHQPHDINIQSVKHTFGGGLRISILEKEKLNLRLDYGYTDNYNKGFYFTIGECF